MPLAVLICILHAHCSNYHVGLIQVIKETLSSVADSEEQIWNFISGQGSRLHYWGNSIIRCFSVVCWVPIGNDHKFVKSTYNLCFEVDCVSVTLQKWPPKQSSAWPSFSYIYIFIFNPVYEKLNIGNCDRRTDQWRPSFEVWEEKPQYSATSVVWQWALCVTLDMSVYFPILTLLFSWCFTDCTRRECELLIRGISGNAETENLT